MVGVIASSSGSGMLTLTAKIWFQALGNEGHEFSVKAPSLSIGHMLGLSGLYLAHAWPWQKVTKECKPRRSERIGA